MGEWSEEQASYAGQVSIGSRRRPCSCTLMALLIPCVNSCSEYIKHLMKENREKEAAIEQAKIELEAKRRKISDDKAQQNSSDPESTTSTLTVSSEGHNRSPPFDTTKRDPPESRGQSRPKRLCLRNQKLQESSLSEGSSGINASTSNEASNRQQGMSIDPMVSSVSDITDSNKGSSNSGSDDSPGQDAVKSTPTVVSDAAVADVPDTVQDSQPNNIGDVVVRERKTTRGKRSRWDETSAVDDVDYGEVFQKSNVPQIVASVHGKIVACKLKATR